MNNAKLVTVLSVLTKDEWHSLKKHILANTSKDSDLFSVFDYFYGNKNKLTQLKESETFVNKHFSHLTVKVFLNHMSTLFQYVEVWLVQKEVEHEKYAEDLFLLKAFNRRGLYNLANQVHHKLEKKINENMAWDIEKSKAAATMLHYQHYSNNPIKYERGAGILQDLIDNYAIYVKEQFLLYKGELYNWGRIQKHDFSQEINAINQLTPLFKNSALSLALEAMNNIYVNNDVTSFLQLYTALLEGRFENHSETQTIINIYLIQRFMFFTQKGFEISQNKTIILNLYNYAIENGVYSEHGKLAAVTFRNIINTLAGIQSYKVIEIFINKWTPIVDTVDTLSLKNISMAINCFHHERYTEIPILTRSLEYNAIDEKIIVLNLNVISAFMDRANEYELYLNSIENFELLLKRNKTKYSEKNYKAFLNLIDFIKKLDKTASSEAIDISIYDYLFNRSWCEKMLQKRKAAIKK